VSPSATKSLGWLRERPRKRRSHRCRGHGPTAEREARNALAVGRAHRGQDAVAERGQHDAPEEPPSGNGPANVAKPSLSSFGGQPGDNEPFSFHQPTRPLRVVKTISGNPSASTSSSAGALTGSPSARFCP
jgi:hypothetical protein